MSIFFLFFFIKYYLFVMDFYTKVHNSHNAHHNGHNVHNGHSPHHHENHNDHNHTHNGHGPPHSRPTSNCSNQMVDIIGMVQNQIVKLEYVYFPLKLVKRQVSPYFFFFFFFLICDSLFFPKLQRFSSRYKVFLL